MDIQMLKMPSPLQLENIKTEADNLVKAGAGKKPEFVEPEMKRVRKTTSGKAVLFYRFVLLIVFLAAFSLSAFRLYHIGYADFARTNDSVLQAKIAGFSFVALAEASFITFMLGFAFLKPSPITNVILVLMLSITASIAFSGNFYESLYDQSGNTLFNWIAAFSPPTLTIGAAFLLEREFHNDRMAANEREREYNERWEVASGAYEDRLGKWMTTRNDPRADHSVWQVAYFHAAINRVGKLNKISSPLALPMAEKRGISQRIQAMTEIEIEGEVMTVSDFLVSPP